VSERKEEVEEEVVVVVEENRERERLKFNPTNFTEKS